MNEKSASYVHAQQTPHVHRTRKACLTRNFQSNLEQFGGADGPRASGGVS
jgi:hypothetical protein